MSTIPHNMTDDPGHEQAQGTHPPSPHRTSLWNPLEATTFHYCTHPHTLGTTQTNRGEELSDFWDPNTNYIQRSIIERQTSPERNREPPIRPRVAVSQTVNMFGTIPPEVHQNSQAWGGAQNHESEPPPRGSRPSKHTRAALRIGTLNIRGYRLAGTSVSDNKWNHVNQIVRDKKIVILLIQEAHLTEERKDDIEKLFGKRLKIYYSSDPGNLSGKGGVAVTLNKNLVKVQGATMKEIVPGRAILVSVNWHKSEVINILTVYAPNVTGNNGDENGSFWSSLNSFFIANPGVKVDIMAGDCNMVEEAQDRAPARVDPEEATEALDKLKQMLYLRDAWKNSFPTRRAFTFIQDATLSMSRIDRIYMTDALAVLARDWEIAPTGIPGTDHELTTVQVAHSDAPVIGKGRWTLRNHVLRDGKFKKKVVEWGAEAIQDIKHLGRGRTADRNPQKIYQKWKSDIIALAKERDKTIVPKYVAEKATVELQLKQALDEPNLDDMDKRGSIRAAMKELDSIEKKYHMAKRERIAVKNRLERETMCKFWTTSNKQAHPCDVIYALKKENSTPSEPIYEGNSVKMAELAKAYHDNLQNKHRPVSDMVKEEKTQQVLGTIKTSMTENQKEELEKIVEPKELITALKHSNNSSAPGLDGIPYKFWKSFNSQYMNNSKQNQRGGTQKITCNIIELLTLVCEDIQRHGISEGSSFAEGWMCPLYKKNERTDIANYRPITCLNTDYKIFTKALSTRLAVVIKDLIHHSQAGFIPGRQITDQTKLIRMMIQYAEAREQNGLIVALDQEKAYDRIEHNYLWRTLETFGIPANFINTVRALYQEAETRVMINGVLSSPWKITRGVRQGDPLSCLLFDLAIEPLAASLRESNLHAYKIPGQAEKLIANLFADDTTTFLSKDDNIDDLNPILGDWCIASGANFNTNKTEIIPIGTLEYRRQVIEERRTRPSGTVIPANICIAEDGTLIRILGE